MGITVSGGMEQATGKIVCVECRRPWDNPDERWQGHLTINEEVACFCPERARGEFAPPDD
jgi:hypothetical protein